MEKTDNLNKPRQIKSIYVLLKPCLAAVTAWEKAEIKRAGALFRDEANAYTEFNRSHPLWCKKPLEPDRKASSNQR